MKDKEEISFNIYWIYDLLNVHNSPDDIEGYRQNAREGLDYFRLATGEGENVDYNTRCLEEMLEFCRDRGFRPVLVNTHVTRYYNKLFSEDFLAGFCARIDRVCEKYGVPYYDYTHDPRINEDHSLFMDSNHMSPEGSKVFTRMLLSDLGLI